MSQNFRLKNEMLFVTAEAVGGFFNADQLRMVALVSENESAVLKVTEDGAIGFMIDEAKTEEIAEKFRESGILLKHYRSEQTPFARACLGELCPRHEQDALGHSIEVATTLQAAFPSGAPFVRIGMNGCAQNCMASGTDDVHIVGESTGYKIQIGGKASEIPQLAQFLAENVQPSDLGTYLQHILTVYLDHRQDEESLHDVVERCGMSIFEWTGAVISTEDSPEDDLLASERTLETENSESADGFDATSEELDQVDFELSTGESSGDLSTDLSSDVTSELELDPDALTTDELGVDTELNDGLETESASPEVSDDLNGALLDAAELDDGLMELGSLNAAELTDLTMNANESLDSGFSSDSGLTTDALDAGSPASEELESTETLDAQDELMNEEIAMGTADGTEDDVSRVTQAMRSEAAIERGMGTSLSASRASDELASHESTASVSSLMESAAAVTSQDVPERAESESDGLSEDLPRSFLDLQDAASHAGALQVKLVEGIVSIKTPSHAAIHLPLESLQQGLRVLLDLGNFRFESFVRERDIVVRYGQTTVTLPLEAVAGSAFGADSETQSNDESERRAA